MKKFLFTLMLGAPGMLYAQKVMPLYPGEIPNSKPSVDKESSEINSDSILIISKISRPTLTVFLPPKEKANGAAVVICPGGGYWIVAAGHEGSDVAKRFNDMGVTAFVVKYRIPDDSTMLNREIGPVQDAERAMQYVREHAKEYNIDPKRIGIMGFSAGGHLASTEGTHFNHNYISNPKKTSLRPDFMLLIYPVISFNDSIGHTGSREQIIGKSPSAEKIREYSNELHVTKQTPPTFLVHAKDDDVVPVQNSQVFYDALKRNKVDAEIYLYEKGGHGFGMTNPTSDVKWMDLIEKWLEKNGWLKTR